VRPPGPGSLAALAALASGCAGVILPPSQTTVGPALVADDAGRAVGIKVSSGAHWASSHAADPRIDVGGGYVFERTSSTPAAHEVGVAARERTAPEDAVRVGHGAYVEVARRIHGGRSDFHRAWLGARGEALWTGADEVEVGVAARISWELFGRGSGSGAAFDGCAGGFGIATGTTALGGYAEAGYRIDPGTGQARFVSTAGVSLRLPFLAGMGFSFCGR
jgi:hypothetical protein